MIWTGNTEAMGRLKYKLSLLTICILAFEMNPNYWRSYAFHPVENSHRNK